MPLDDPHYEIQAVVRKHWRLLASVTDSRQAIEEATKLQHSEKYPAIRVVVRTLDQAAEHAGPRLLYQFTRPSLRARDQVPPSPRIGEYTTPYKIAPFAQSGGGLYRRLAVRFWIVVTAALLITIAIVV